MNDSITSTYTSLKHAEIAHRVGMAITAKAIDTMRIEGAEVLKLIESAGAIAKTMRDPRLGRSIDVLA